MGKHRRNNRRLRRAVRKRAIRRDTLDALTIKYSLAVANIVQATDMLPQIAQMIEGYANLHYVGRSFGKLMTVTANAELYLLDDERHDIVHRRGDEEIESISYKHLVMERAHPVALHSSQDMLIIILNREGMNEEELATCHGNNIECRNEAYNMCVVIVYHITSKQFRLMERQDFGYYQSYVDGNLLYISNKAYRHYASTMYAVPLDTLQWPGRMHWLDPGATIYDNIMLSAFNGRLHGLGHSESIIYQENDGRLEKISNIEHEYDDEFLIFDSMIMTSEDTMYLISKNKIARFNNGKMEHNETEAIGMRGTERNKGEIEMVVTGQRITNVQRMGNYLYYVQCAGSDDERTKEIDCWGSHIYRLEL